MCASFVAAWMPETHNLIIQEALEKAPNSLVGKVISQHPQDCTACVVLDDIAVFYYFADGFNAIGREYKATHSLNFCKSMITVAQTQPDYEAALTCAYCACLHHTADSVSHNFFIPASIQASYMPNGITHVFAEEKVNDIIYTNALASDVKSALVAKAPVHKELFRKVLTQPLKEGGNRVDFDKMYDTFVKQVSESKKFSPGFVGFVAIPMGIHVVLFTFILFNAIIIWFLYKRGMKGIFSKVTTVISLGCIAFIVFAYVIFFQGEIWRVFQAVSTPVSAIIPTPNYQAYLNTAVDKSVGFMNSGAAYLTATNVPDPAGTNALIKASQSVAWVTYSLVALMLAAIGYMAYKIWKEG